MPKTHAYRRLFPVRFFSDGKTELLQNEWFSDKRAGAHFKGMPDPVTLRKAAENDRLLLRMYFDNSSAGLHPVHSGYMIISGIIRPAFLSLRYATASSPPATASARYPSPSSMMIARSRYSFKSSTTGMESPLLPYESDGAVFSTFSGFSLVAGK